MGWIITSRPRAGHTRGMWSQGSWQVVVVLLCGAAGCGGRVDAGPDAGPDADPSCHYDCFGYSACVEGVVTTWAHTPVPCEHWDGACPRRVTYQCERGCRTNVESIGPFDEPREMCEEHRPKRIGDPCVDESGCRPEVATWDAQGVVTNVYLACDVARGVCVARDPPVVPDWLAACGLEPDGQPGFAYGVAPSALCAAGVCLYVERDTCVAQGCTIPCAGDGDCPPGAVCRPDWAVCKPGPPNAIGIGLVCPST